MVEEHGRACGFLALRPPVIIFPGTADRGFRLGHSLFGTDDFEVVQFAFHFYGWKTCNTLLNPSSPLVRTVLTTMVERGDYFFFAISAGGVTAFRSAMGQERRSQMPWKHAGPAGVAAAIAGRLRTPVNLVPGHGDRG
jgi:hypothetical protein